MAGPPPPRWTSPSASIWTSLLRALEEHLPTRWVEEDVSVGGGDDTAHLSVTRGPFSASFHGDTVTLSATVAYALRTSVDLPLLPDPTVSCGTDPDRPAPRMHIAVSARLSLAADWTLSSNTSNVEVEPPSSRPQRPL